MKNFIFIFILLLLASCRVFEPDTVVEGKVWDPALNKPVAGLVVTLSEIPTNFSTRCCAEDVQTVYTDANGEYHFEPFKARMASWYEVDFDNDAWWYSHNFFYITKETTNYDSITAVQYAKIDFGFINTNPSDSDIFRFRGFNTSINKQIWGEYDGGWGVRYGNAQNPADDDPPKQIGNYFIEWEVERNGITTYFSDSLWLGVGDHKVFEIHY